MKDIVLCVVFDHKNRHVLLAKKSSAEDPMAKCSVIGALYDEDDEEISTVDLAWENMFNVLRHCPGFKGIIKTPTWLFNTVYSNAYLDKDETYWVQVYAAQLDVNDYSTFYLEGVRYDWHDVEYDEVTELLCKSYRNGVLLDVEDPILQDGVVAYAISAAHAFFGREKRS